MHTTIQAFLNLKDNTVRISTPVFLILTDHAHNHPNFPKNLGHHHISPSSDHTQPTPALKQRSHHQGIIMIVIKSLLCTTSADAGAQRRPADRDQLILGQLIGTPGYRSLLNKEYI